MKKNESFTFMYVTSRPGERAPTLSSLLVRNHRINQFPSPVEVAHVAVNKQLYSNRNQAPRSS
jgi:hypothetical protein